MDRVNALRAKNGNFNLAWLIMEHTLEDGDVEFFTTQELQSVSKGTASEYWTELIHNELTRRNHG